MKQAMYFMFAFHFQINVPWIIRMMGMSILKSQGFFYFQHISLTTKISLQIYHMAVDRLFSKHINLNIKYPTLYSLMNPKTHKKKK